MAAVAVDNGSLALELVERQPVCARVVCDDKDLLYEEAPQAYKDVERVLADLVEAGVARILATLRPLLTYKTASRR